MCVFFFKQKTAYEMRISDWSSDVCSSDLIAGDTLGIALGVSAAQTPSQDERYNTWGYSGSGTADDPYVLGGAKPYVQSNMLKRYGAVATIEWQPSDSFHSTFDAQIGRAHV